MRRRLEQAGFPKATPRTFWMICGIVAGRGGVCIAIATHQKPLVIALAVFVVGLGLPRWVLGFLTNRRKKKFTENFANAIDVIVRSVDRACPPTRRCASWRAKLPNPVGSEFHSLVESLKVGVTLDQALKRMMESMPTPEVGFFAIVMTIQSKSGGNLSEALGNLAAVLRDRKRLQGKIKAMSSEAKASAMIIGSLPPGVMGIVYLTTPGLYRQAVHRTCRQSDAGGLRDLDGLRHHGDAQDDQLQALGRQEMDHLMNLLFDKSFLVTLFVGILAFATVVTLGVPYLESNGLDDRLKSVARRREELRAKHHAALNAKRGACASSRPSYMKATLDRFKLGNILEGEKFPRKAGQRRLSRPGAADHLHVLPFRDAVHRVRRHPVLPVPDPASDLVAGAEGWGGLCRRPDRFLCARPVRQQHDRPPPDVHHARLSRRAGPDADLRGIRHVDRERVSPVWRARSAPSRPNWPRNWR